MDNEPSRAPAAVEEIDRPSIVEILYSWEVFILVNLLTHLCLTLLAGIRRSKASGWQRVILWVAYQLSNWIAPFTLSNVYTGNTESPRHQLVVFWAMFVLQHLGGPDNISAFSLEDHALSRRELLSALGEVSAAGYGLYKYVYDPLLFAASSIIFFLGAYKYFEAVFALWRGKLDNICSSSKKQASNSSEKKKQASTYFTACAGSGSVSVSGWLIRRGVDNDLHDEEALMVAHDMLLFCKRAMAVSSVHTGSPDNDDDLDTSRKIFTLKCENMCKVVEMELSLMYDILYTKAAVVHTWPGYSIRLASLPALGSAMLLFVYYCLEHHAALDADLMISLVLLIATFLLEMRWLLRALGSTWAHAFLQSSRLYNAALCTKIWRRIRHMLVSLDLARLQFMAAPRSPSSHRSWSGTVPLYNLLRKCTQKSIVCGGRHQQLGHKLSDDVKRMVFSRVKKILRSTYEKADKDEDAYSMEDITTSWGQLAVKRRHRKLKYFHLAFGREFQEDILVWHIATQIFLVFWKDQSVFHGNNELTHAKAIKVLSEHLMFLVAVQPHMLPGLALRSLYVVTLKYLQEIWGESGVTAGFCSSYTTRENNLARILVDKKEDETWGFGHDEASIVSDGANLAIELLGADQSKMPELLELVFNVWVDKLLHAATGCDPESHAKQLSYGGSLTTIVWLMAQHAAPPVPFQIGQSGPEDDEEDDDDEEEIPEFENWGDDYENEEDGEEEWEEEEGEEAEEVETPEEDDDNDNDEENEEEELQEMLGEILNVLEEIQIVIPHDEPPSAIGGSEMFPPWPRDPTVSALDEAPATMIKPTKGDFSTKKRTKGLRKRNTRRYATLYPVD